MGSTITTAKEIKNNLIDPGTGIKWSLLYYDLDNDEKDLKLDDDYLYSGLIGYGKKLNLLLFGSSSPFSDVSLEFAAEAGTTSEILFYVFQPTSPGPLYFYADDLQATLKGDLSLPIGSQYNLILTNSEVSLRPIVIYPERVKVTGEFKAKSLRLESVDKNGQSLTWFTAGSDDRDAFITSISAGENQGIDVNLSLESVRLGKAILGYESNFNGSVALSYKQNSATLGLSGNLTFSGLSTTLSVDINLDSLDVEAIRFRLQSGQELELSSDISVIAGDWELSYSKDTSSLDTKRLYSLIAKQFQLKLGDTALAVGGELTCSLDSNKENPTILLERGTVSLQDLLTIPLGELYIQVGKGSQITFERQHTTDPNKPGDLAVKLSGTLSLLEKIKGEPASGEPLFQFSVRPEQPISWNESTGFQLNARFDLGDDFQAGPFVVGNDAHVAISDQSIVINPDLKLDSQLFNIILKPIQEPLDLLFSPLINPMLDLLGKEIPLPATLQQALKPKEWYEWGNLEWNASIKIADEIYGEVKKAFIDLVEHDKRGNDPWNDGKLQIIDILDYSLETLWQSANTGALTKLAKTLGIDQDIAEAFESMPQPKLAEKLGYLNYIKQAINLIKGSEISSESELIDLTNFRFNIDYTNKRAEDTSRSTELAKQAQDAISAAINGSGNKESLLSSLTNLSEKLSLLEAPPDNGLKVQAPSIKPFIQFPFFSDLLGTLKALLNDKTFSLVEVGVNSSLKLGFAYSQIIDLLPYIGFPLPLTFGLDTRLGMELNPALGFSTKASALKKATKDVTDILSSSEDPGLLDKTKQLLNSVGQLLFPVPNSSSDPYGLYLTHPQDRPLLKVNSEIRLNAGIDYRLIGLRTYTGLGADFGVSITKTKDEAKSKQAGKLYLADVAQAIQPLLTGSPNTDPEGWMGSTIQTLGNLISLFDYRLQAYIPWGVEPKLPIAGWIKDLPYVTGKISLPAIHATSGKIAFAGPVRGGTVHFDRRRYANNEFQGSGDFLLNKEQEPSVQTDHTGRFDLVLDTKIWDANQDGEINFKDGLTIASSSDDPDSSNHLVDSITGLDLGHPLVGLPGHNISILTTLKYMMLGRWSPSSTVYAPDGTRSPLTPELINELMKHFLGAPEKVLDDDFNPYFALQGSAQDQEAAVNSLRFSYEQIFLIRVVANLLEQLEPDYSSGELWGYDPSRKLDPILADSVPILATNGWGYALTQLFGYASISKTASPALKEGHDIFNLTDSRHLRLFFETILAAYPTQELWSRYEQSRSAGDLTTFQQAFARAVRAPRDLPDNAQALDDLVRNHRHDAGTVKDVIDSVFGPTLDALATGFVTIVQAFRQQVDLATTLSNSLPSDGVEMLIPAIAGIKRELISATIPALVSRSLSIKGPQASSDVTLLPWLNDQLTKPLTVDSLERDFSYALRFADQPVQRKGNRMAIRVQLTTAHGGRETSTIETVPAPDYGLTVRARLGGNARPGIDYGLVGSEPGASPSLAVLRFAPGAEEAWLELELNPSSLDAIDPLNLQLQLLNADSGVAIDAAQSVLNLPLTSNGQVATVSAVSSFTIPDTGSTSLQTSDRSDGSGPSGMWHQIRPSLSEVVLPHIADFNPDSDVITVDAAAVLELRRRSFTYSPSDDAAKDLDPSTWKALIQAAWEKHLSLQDHDLVVVAGVLLDRPSGTPLASVSAPPNAAGQAPAWGQLLGGGSLRFSYEGEQSIELGGQFYAAGTRLALAFEPGSPSPPWSEATALVLTDADGGAGMALAHLAGSAAGQAVGYSPHRLTVVQLPTSTGQGKHRLWLQPYGNPGAGIELNMRLPDHDRRGLELVLPDGKVWGQFISNDPTLQAVVKAPDLLVQVEPRSPELGLANLNLVPAGSQLPGDPASPTTGLTFERSTDGGQTWQATTAMQRDLTEGRYRFRTRQQQQDGTELFGSTLSLLVNQEGVVEPTPFTPTPTQSAALPLGSVDLNLQTIGPDQRQILGLALDQLGATRSQHDRELNVELRLMREATLNNKFAFALLRRSDAQLIDTITGQELGSIQDLGRLLQNGQLDTLRWSASRHGEAIDLTDQIRLAAEVDLSDHCLVPLLQVGTKQTMILSSSAEANPDGRQHVLSFGQGNFGFEDQIRSSDWDMDDAIIQVVSLGLTTRDPMSALI
jgi:hypothetical protein